MPKRAAEDADVPTDKVSPTKAEPSKKAKETSNGAGGAPPKIVKQTSGMKAQAGGAESIPRTSTPRPAHADCLVLAHWNIAGLNGLLNSEERMERLRALVAAEDPDVLALSEHKLSKEKVFEMRLTVESLASVLVNVGGELI